MVKGQPVGEGRALTVLLGSYRKPRAAYLTRVDKKIN
jgi:hypothetical protein